MVLVSIEKFELKQKRSGLVQVLEHKPTAYSSPHLFELTFEQSDVQ